MSRIAVDIALLPDEAMTVRAIDINSGLDPSCASRIVLDGETCLPHVSLAMGCIEYSDIELIGNALRAVADEHPLGELVVTGVVTSLNRRDEAVSAFALRATPVLKTLHEQVMEAMQAHFSYDVTEAMMHGDEPIAGTSLEWIRTFREKAAFGAFFPHITLGYGAVTKDMCFPMGFAARTLALCHLGNHCTCRTVLSKVNI